MATLKRWRRENHWKRNNLPERSIDIDKDYDYNINRYQKANWGDVEAKEAHASVVKYLWRKEHELNKKKEELKKQISKQVDINASETRASESTNSEVTSTKLESRALTKREIDAPMRGIHFRSVEDKTMDKLKLIKSERKLFDNMSYIEKVRSKENKDIEDDISDDLKKLIRGRTAYQISAALLDDSEREVRLAKRRELAKLLKEQPPKRGIYEIMADRNNLGITHHDDNEQYQLMRELRTHRDHDYRWNRSADYLNLVGYRMQNDIPQIHDGCFMQNHGEIVWGPRK